MPEKQVTSTRQSLSTGPKDMPDRGGEKKPQAGATTGTRVPLGRTEIPVAHSGIHAGMGEVQVTSSKCALNRTEADPYAQFNTTMPRPPIPGKKKG